MELTNQYKLKITPLLSLEIMRVIIAHAYNQLHAGLFIGLSGATIIVIFLYHSSNHFLLFSWYILFLSVTLIRMISIKIYKDQKFPNEKFIFWNNIYVIGALLGGLCWGLTSILFYPLTNDAEQILSILTIILVATWSITTLSAILGAVIAFIMAVTIPFIIQFIIFPETTSMPFVVIFAIFIAYLLIHSVKTHNIIVNSYVLRAENNILLKDILSTENQLIHLKNHDLLTKINNRRFFYEQLSTAIKNAATNKELLAVLYIDFDNFNKINTTFGSHMGDQLLIIMIKKLQKTAIDKNLIFRVGDDEFAILLEYMKNRENIEKIAKEISQIITTPIKIADNTIIISASIGIGIYPDNGEDADTLIKEANNAMKYIKKHGKNNIYFSKNGLVD